MSSCLTAAVLATTGLVGCYASHEVAEVERHAGSDAAGCVSDEHLTVSVTATGCDPAECDELTGHLTEVSAAGDTLRVRVRTVVCECLYELGVGASLATQLHSLSDDAGVFVRLHRDARVGVVEARMDTVPRSGAIDETQPWIYLVDTVAIGPSIRPDGVTSAFGDVTCGDPEQPTGGEHRLRVTLPSGTALEASPGETIGEPVHHLGAWILHVARAWSGCEHCGLHVSPAVAFVVARDLP